MKHWPACCVLLCCLLSLFACRDNRREAGRGEPEWMGRYREFLERTGDSLTARPQWVRAQALEQMRGTADSLEWYYYAALVMKTCFFTFDIDSMHDYFRRGEAFCSRHPRTPLLNDLEAEYDNLMGNLYVRLGKSDTAVFFFEKAYEERMKGVRKEAIPDILMNLADVLGRQGRYDLEAYWYRRALLICDSLDLDSKKIAVYYGLGQTYKALRDFKLCDYYYGLAGQHYSRMQVYEQYIYLNNRGTSYYFREDYERAMRYFRSCRELLSKHQELAFERNLCDLNMADVFQKMGETDSADCYLRRCRSFFEEVNSLQALYYVDTQELGLALKRHDIETARRILDHSVAPAFIEPDIWIIRNGYLQQYYETQGDYRKAYHYQSIGQQMEDSLRGERVRMLVADASLRYAQDSMLMVKNVLIEKQKNEVLKLRQTKIFWVAMAVVAILIGILIHMHHQKKRALLQADNLRVVSSLRMENIRNRLSPHFIFNVLSREMVELDEAERQKMASLVKLMRRNLELVEQFCVTLADELGFVQAYIELDCRSLGDSFRFEIEIAPDVHPEKVWLPSMLIQIPVENAVKHALREKEGERRLWITIRRASKGIAVVVTDNGGGYRPNSRNRGIGTGMKVIMQTIHILNQKNREKLDVSVHNVTSPSGETGCEVCFLLPEKYNYYI